MFVNLNECKFATKYVEVLINLTKAVDQDKKKEINFYNEKKNNSNGKEKKRARESPFISFC